MSIQDSLERILRELHIIVSRAPVSDLNEEYVLVPKKEVQKQLGNLSETVRLMMDQYEVTQQSRNRGELEAENQRMEIIRNANHQAQDIYAASVIYSEDALGRIQDIINEAERSSKEILKRLGQEMEEEKRIIRSNQVELITQLEDMKDTAKYMKLIEERNRQIAKEKAKKKEKEQSREYRRKEDREPAASDGQAKEEIKAPVEDTDEIVYEKPVIKINQEYFKKAGLSAGENVEEEEEAKDEAALPGEKAEGRPGFFSFGRKS